MQSSGRKKSRVDVVWSNMRGKVIEVINEIVREDGGTAIANADEIFKYRTAAAKRVFESLTMDEKLNIEQKIKEGTDVIPESVKTQ